MAACAASVCANAQFSRAIWPFTSEENIEQIDASEKVTVIDFATFPEDQIKMNHITAVKKVPLPADVAAMAGGDTALEIYIEDNQDGEKDRLTLELNLDGQPVSTEMCRALVFYYYIDEDFANQFLGRYDMRVFMDEANLAEPAVRPGWNQYVLDFETMHSIPTEFSKLKIQMGDIFEGYGSGKILIGPIRMVQCPELPENADLIDTLKNDPSWAKRYTALQLLAKNRSVAGVEAAMEASADSAQFIRNTSVDVMATSVPRLGTQCLPVIEAGMNSDEWRTRLAAIELLVEVRELFPQYAKKAFNHALLDDNFFVRECAIKWYLDNGKTKAEVAALIIPVLGRGDKEQMRLAIRSLRDIGPRAEAALPALLSIIRDPYESTSLRCEALATVWWVDEAPLTPEDWVLGLSVNPDEVHLHLFNKSMERLITGKAMSVPALLDVLRAKNPVLRSRALACLRLMGPDAEAAIPTLEKLSENSTWYLAYQAQAALRAIQKSDEPVDVLPPHDETASTLSVTDDGTGLVVGNGILEMVFEHGNREGGPTVVRRIDGPNLFDGSWIYDTLAFRHSKGKNVMERRIAQKKFGSPIPKGEEGVTQDVFYQDDQIVDMMVKYAGKEVEYEFHYVLEVGKSGFYTYVVTRNVTGREMEDKTSFSEEGIGRLSQLMPITWGIYDYGFCADDLRRPANFVPHIVSAYTENYPDIYQCTFRLPDATVFAKHEWDTSEKESDVVGFAGMKEGGFWMITPSQESKARALPRRKAGQINQNCFLNGITGKYYIKSKMLISPDWEKVSGPFLFYINNGENIEEMWVDAQRQAEVEKKQFPYNWLNAFNFHDRGLLKGKVEIQGGENPEGTYVVLSNPIDTADEDELTTWMRNAGEYIYWTQADQDGNYEIPDVRSDTYSVYAFKPGVYGLVESDGKITIKKGETTHPDKLTIVPESAGRLIWQIGDADGGSTEFKNGNNYHVWENYVRYREDFPDGVHYTVGESDWSQDWNYIQPACVKSDGAPTTWTIDFDIDELPKNEALFTIACAGRGAKAFVLLNGEKLGALNVSYNGSQHVRTHPYGEIVRRKYEIQPEQFRKGKNTIQLTFSKAKSNNKEIDEHFKNWNTWLAYDFLRLEEVK